MNVMKVLGLFCLLSIALNVSCRSSKPASAELSIGQQAYDKGEYASALKVFSPLAKHGDPVAENYLGVMCESGRGVPQDYNEAARWYRRGADHGNSVAQLNLGGLYHNGQGVPQDYKEALKWYRLAANQGYSSAQYDLGLMYENGQGVPQDYKDALKWYRLAAEQGDPDGATNLGVKYAKGLGVPQDYIEAVNWYRLAAEQGHSTAQYNLAECYARGRGVPQNYGESVRWCRLAAEQGLPEAQHSLGVSYEDGQGVPKDSIQAYFWYNLAGANGNADGFIDRENRDRIAQKLTPAQLAEAQRLALEWSPKTWEALTSDVSEVDATAAKSTAPKSLKSFVGDAPPPLPKGYTLDPETSRRVGTATGTATPKGVAGMAQSIQAAEDAGLVRTSYRNPGGSSSGDSVVLIVVKISGPDRLVLSIPSGLTLKSPSLLSQSMAISGLGGRDVGGGKYAPEQFITLTDDKPIRYIIAAYCTEFHKDNPPPDKFDFQVGATPDPVLACILNEARKEKLTVSGTQAAVWVHTDHVTFQQMSTRMAVGKEEWAKAEAVASRCTLH